MLSLIIFAAGLVYGERKYQILIDRADTNYNEYIETSAIDHDEIFGFDKTNFNFAFKIVSE